MAYFCDTHRNDDEDDEFPFKRKRHYDSDRDTYGYNLITM